MNLSKIGKSSITIGLTLVFFSFGMKCDLCRTFIYSLSTEDVISYVGFILVSIGVALHIAKTV